MDFCVSAHGKSGDEIRAVVAPSGRTALIQAQPRDGRMVSACLYPTREQAAQIVGELSGWLMNSAEGGDHDDARG